MILSTWKILALVATVLHETVALPSHHIDDTVNSNIKTGTFSNPSNIVRPKFRYWLPDASIDTKLVAADIKSFADVGAGGIEFLPYYSYGGVTGKAATDWGVYGFGLPAFNKVLKAAAQATKDNGLIMDFCMGPQSGQGVPAKPDNPGLSYELVSVNATVKPGSTFNGKVPGWGSGTLVSITTAMITHAETKTYLNSLLGLFDQLISYTQYTIAADSLTDITRTTKSDGTVSVTFPTNASAIEFVIYASYYRQSLVRACIPGQSPSNFLQNGSFAVDHFSSDGARVTTDFLEQYVLVNGVKELFKEIGNYIWEDSVEITATVYWTPALSQTFKSMHGYDIGPYAMLLAQSNGNGANIYIAPSWFITDAPDQGQSYVADYRSTLTQLYGNYLQHLERWTHDYLGLQFSAQVGYNLPVDMLQLIPLVDAPETESLTFNDNIDRYRQYIGPAHLADKRIISCEIGAVSLEAYAVTFPNLLRLTNRAFAAGINMMVIHGAPYSYSFPETTWPGYTTFNYFVAEMHSRHQPAWRHGYREYMDYVSRTQFIQQSGTPKIDLAFWDKPTSSLVLNDLNDLTDIVSAGYTYEYLSPENFQLPQAVVTNKVLSQSGPAYKVLVLKRESLLTVAGIDKLAEYAGKGLTIFILNGLPTTLAGHDAAGTAYVTSMLSKITRLGNVYQIASSDLLKTLRATGIQPSTQVSAKSLWYTTRRQTPDGTDYYFVYNDGNSSSGSVSFASQGKPYYFDSWSGAVSPVLEYTVKSGYTSVNLQLAAGQTLIIAFTPISQQWTTDTPSIHAISTSAPILGYSYSKSTGLIAKVPATTASATLVTSDSVLHTLDGSHVSSAFTLSNWTLIAETWDPPSDLSDANTLGNIANTTYKLPTINPWPQIAGLAQKSGVGYYSTSFVWPTQNSASTSQDSGAFIDFGPIMHSLSVAINGKRLPPLDLSSAKADITPYLVVGKNTVEAVAATTLSSVVNSIFSQVMTTGGQPILPFAQLGREALATDVIIIPYKGVKVAT